MATREKKIVREEVDISEEARELGSFDPSSLDEIDRLALIKSREFRKRFILVLAAAVLLAILGICIYVVACVDDETTRDWARQLLSTIVGFAVGFVWPNSNTSDDS